MAAQSNYIEFFAYFDPRKIRHVRGVDRAIFKGLTLRCELKLFSFTKLVNWSNAPKEDMSAYEDSCVRTYSS